MRGCGKEFILNGVHPRKEVCGNFLCDDCKNKHDETFEKLWKIKVLRGIIKFEEKIGDGKITRTCKSDNLRTIDFVKYGFEEGVKFANGEKR